TTSSNQTSKQVDTFIYLHLLSWLHTQPLNLKLVVMNRWNKVFLIILLILTSVLLVLAVHYLRGSRSQEAVPEIKAQELSQHLKYLSSDELVGRLSGTPGAEKAAE